MQTCEILFTFAEHKLLYFSIMYVRVIVMAWVVQRKHKFKAFAAKESKTFFYGTEIMLVIASSPALSQMGIPCLELLMRLPNRIKTTIYLPLKWVEIEVSVLSWVSNYTVKLMHSLYLFQSVVPLSPMVSLWPHRKLIAESSKLHGMLNARCGFQGVWIILTGKWRISIQFSSAYS